MICIGICDDEKYIVSILKEKIVSCIRKYTTDVVYLELFSGEELINCEKKLDILFLDIDMPGMDGIAAGKIFRSKQKDCKIVMATVRSDRMKEAFFLEAYRFITKPFEDVEIEEAVQAFVKSQVGFQRISAYENRRLCEVYQHQIVYVQTYDSYTEFCIGHRMLRSEKSLRKLEGELDSRIFIRIDKKYMINLKYVDDYREGIVFIAGMHLKVARRRILPFEERYREFDLRYR